MIKELIKRNINCYLREGVANDHNSILHAIATLKHTDVIISESLIGNAIIDYILKNITATQFDNINNGNLRGKFMNYSKQSAFQNYLEYINNFSLI